VTQQKESGNLSAADGLAEAVAVTGLTGLADVAEALDE
jgi:hypothetical protein